MNLDLTGKTALVCGSSQGIGKAAAIELSSMGCNVVCLARDPARLRAVVEDDLARRSGQKHSILVADFSDTQAVESVVGEWVQAGGRAEILLNNTGGPPGGRAIDADSIRYLEAFQMHLINAQTLARLLVPGMKQAGYGRIINVISTSVKQPISGLGVSNTVRGAVANWSKTIAGELAADGITVNNVLPGATRTGRLESILATTAARKSVSVEDEENHMLASIPARRFGAAEEIAAAIAFLASPSAGYITGINLPVDGGRTQCL